MLLAEVFYLLQHVGEHLHHAPLVLALRLDRPQDAILLEAGHIETDRQAGRQTDRQAGRQTENERGLKSQGRQLFVGFE